MVHVQRLRFHKGSPGSEGESFGALRARGFQVKIRDVSANLGEKGALDCNYILPGVG